MQSHIQLDNFIFLFHRRLIQGLKEGQTQCDSPSFGSTSSTTSRRCAYTHLLMSSKQGKGGGGPSLGGGLADPREFRLVGGLRRHDDAVGADAMGCDQGPFEHQVRVRPEQ